MTPFKCDHLNQKEKIDRFSPQFFTPIKLRRCKIWWIILIFFSYQSGQSKFPLTLYLQLQYSVKLQRPAATNCCHDLYTFVTFDTVSHVWPGPALRSNFLTLFLQFKHPTTIADWSAYTSLPQEKINTTWSCPQYIQSVTSRTCLEYLIIPWWIKGNENTFKTRLIDIYNCLDELYIEYQSLN